MIQSNPAATPASETTGAIPTLQVRSATPAVNRPEYTGVQQLPPKSQPAPLKLPSTLAHTYLTEFIAKMKRDYSGKAGHNPWPKIYAAEALLKRLNGCAEVEESALAQIRLDFPVDYVPIVSTEVRAGNIDYSHLNLS